MVSKKPHPGSRHRKLALVGGSPSSEMLAPFEDPEYEVWVLGNRSQNYPRFDKIFEIHDDLSEHDERYAQWLVDKNTPMVVGSHFPIRADHVEVFPFDASAKLFGSLYLTSSPAYMLCYAILHGYTHIELYGVDMHIDDHEYFWQLKCVEAWVGFARGRGITVIPHKTSPVCRSTYVEGVESGGKPDFSVPPFTEDELLKLAHKHTAKIEVETVEINKLNAEISRHKDIIHSNDGARQAYLHLARVARSVESGIEVDTLETTVRHKD
jgi:hypothetical protein